MSFSPNKFVEKFYFECNIKDQRKKNNLKKATTPTTTKIAAND